MAITDDYERYNNKDEKDEKDDKDDKDKKDKKDDKEKKDDKDKGSGGVDRPPAPGCLAHTVTLKPSVVGRSKRPLSADVLHNLSTPTLLVPAPEGPQPSSSTVTTTTIPRGLPFGGVKIMLMATSSTSCHLVDVEMRGGAYGWGRKNILS